MTYLSIAGAGGGGCFRKGTQVQLERGKTIAIENLKPGDEILAFDEDGELHVARVEKLHIHEDPQPVFRVKFWRGEVYITRNHWVLNQYSSFVEIGTLGIDDALVDGMGHLRPIISFEYVGQEPVYNLTVEKYHTFIANGIRVHNGGHRETYPVVAGAMGGGGKGGGGRAAKEDPESLQSKTMVSILDLLGEGQIGGLLKGAQSIFFNDTPLQNSDGTYNFSGVTWEARYGLPNQTYIPGYADIESPFNVSVQCKVLTPVTVTVTNPNADRVRAIVTLPSLTSTDLTTGDLHGTTVEYKFQISTNGGPYLDAIADYVWVAANIGTQGGLIAATSTDPSAKRITCTVRLDATGTISYKDFTWGATAVIQPQTWNGSAFVNYGPTITITTDPYAASFASRFAFLFSSQNKQIVKDVFVDAPSNIVRFVTISKTTNATLSIISASAYTGSPVIKISGKTRSRYQRSHLLQLPKPGSTWNIRMVRITPDSTSSALTNDTYFDSYVEIVDTKIAYVNSAVAGISIDSSLFNKIPSRSYLVNGLYIRVPANYDPVSRTYTGTWNGTFKIAVSNNPAWILFDLLTNTRYGLGQYLGESGQYVNKAQLYQIGKYCDEMVSDGYDGFEPRFTINTVINSPADAYKVITDISSAFQGMSYWSGGMVSFTQDAPVDPSMIYGPANVVNGTFNYSGSARKDRHSVVHVTWNDPLDGYKQKIEYVEDAALVAKYGIRKHETVAFGCTSRGQANRVGRWILYTEQFESDLITFEVGQDSALVMPGEVVRINDPLRAGKRMAGRLISATATSATLDAPLTISSAAEISFILPDGTFTDRPLLQAPGTYTTVTWSSALATLPLTNAMFIVSEVNLVPLLARVVAIGQSEANKKQFVITAVEHNPAKFAAIENGWTLTKPVTSTVKVKPEPPTNLVLTDIIYQSGPNYASKLHASWDNNFDGIIKGWNVRLLGPSKIWKDFGTTVVASFEEPNVIDGEDYVIEVRAVNVIGIQSDPAITSRTVLGKEAPPSNVTGATATEVELGVELKWNHISDIDRDYYEIREGTDWATATNPRTTPANSIQLGPQTAGLHTWLIRAKDTSKHYSLNDAVVNFTVGLPATPTVVAAFVGSTIEVGWTAVPTADSYFVEIVVGGLVKRSFITTDNHFSYTLQAAISDGGPWRSITVRVKAKRGNIMGLAGEATSDTNAAPAAPTLILVPGIKSVSITVSRCEELDYAGTLIHASQTAGFTPDATNLIYDDGTFYLQDNISGTWYYRAAHYDDFGKSGLNYSTEVSALALAGVAGITTVTALPANPSAVNGQLAIFLDVADVNARGLYGWDGVKWVSTRELANGSITYEKFDPSIIFNVEIEDGEILSEHIADGAVKYQKMDPDLAFEVEVEAGEITTTHIADDAISTPKLKAGAVIASKIAADQITANHLQADSVTTLKIAANQILSNHILANQILSGHIQSDSITTIHIVAGAVTAEKMTVSDLSAITANMGAITAGSLTLDNQGFIRGGQTGYNTGTGFWWGYSGGAYKMSLGSSSGNYITWDGANLWMRGNIGLGPNNSIAAGQGGWNTGVGFWVGYTGGTYKLSIGNPAGRALLWDGSTMTVQGDIVATGNIQGNAVTQVSSAHTGSQIEVPFDVVAGFTRVQFLQVNKTTTNPLPVIMFAQKTNTGFGVIMQFRINGVVYHESYFDDKKNFYFQWCDTTAIGVKDYELWAQTVYSGGGDPNNPANTQFRAKIYNVSLIAVEAKR